jgi:hypothetical protein
MIVLYSSHAILIIMNPDEQKNYWKQDSASIDEVPSETAVTNTNVNQTAESSQGSEALSQPISWTASEYIHLEKNFAWYVIFVLVVLGFIALDIFVLKSWTFSLLVIVMAIAIVVYIQRPPKDVRYTLSARQGLYVGEKLYSLADYRAFGLIRDGEHHSIMLIPLKRFGSGVSVYFPEEVGEQIVDILGAVLPMENLKLDAVDVIVRRLRL